MSRKGILIASGLFMVVMACRKSSEVSPSCNQSHRWSTDVVPILTAYCTDSTFGGCHQSGSQYGDWTDYAQFKYKVDGGHVQEHCIDNDEMPPVYSNGPHPLKASDKQTLRCWIEAGAQKD